MAELGFVVNCVISGAYLAIAWTILTRVLVQDRQWKTNPLATATGAIFLSCGIGHGLHAEHVWRYGASDPMNADWHLIAGDAITACVATWYWAIRGRLTALRGSGALFQDEAEEKTRVLDALLDGVFVFDVLRDEMARPVDLRVRAWNSAVLELTKRTAEQVRGATFTAAFPLATTSGLLETYLEVARTGEAAKFGVPWFSDGSVYGSYDVQCSRYDADTLVLALRDTTARTMAERARTAADRELAAAFTAAPVGLASVDENGGVRLANSALSALLGGTPEDLVGRDWMELVHPDDLALARDVLQSAPVGGTSAGVDLRMLGRSGPRWVHVAVVAVANAQGGVDHRLVHHVDVEDRKRYESQLRHVADHDPLTGLANRRRLEEALQTHCARVQRQGPVGALLLLDLDHFKDVNDTLGHAAGDELIRHVADLLQAEVRETDMVARLGGDELALLLTDGGAGHAGRVAQRVVDVVRLAAPIGGADSTLTVTASVGVAVFGDVEASPETMLIAADLSMYDAKDAGRDRWSAYKDAGHQQPRAKSRLEWLERVRRALRDGDLVLHGQPIVSLADGEQSMVELLLRLRMPDGSLELPATFLYLVEQSDLMHEVDLHVVERAIGEVRRRREAGERTKVCVNVSGRTLSDPLACSRLEELVVTADLAPGDLVIEITETAAIAGMRDAREGLLALQRAGCLIALDDFGAGFGTLAYVKHLPFDILKIDGQFVSHCLTDAVDLTVVDAVVQLARGLGKQVVAEHVPDTETLELLRAHGVHHVQGNHVSPPAPLPLKEIALPGPRSEEPSLIDLP